MNRILTILLLVGALCACRSSKPAATATDVAAMDSKDAFDAVTASYATWTDIQVPVKITTTAPAKFSLSGNAVMVRGRQIHMSFRMMGFEVAALYVDRDSVFLADKFHHYLYAESFKKVFRGYDVTITDIQDLLLGRAFLPGLGTLTADMRSKVNFDRLSPGLWSMQPRRQPKDLKLVYNFATSSALDDTPVMSTLSFEPDGHESVKANYGGFVRSLAGPVAGEVGIVAPVGGRTLRGSLEFSVNKAKWNTGRSPSWKRPSGYQELDNSNIGQLLKGF